MKTTTTATYGGDVKSEACDFGEGFKVVLFKDSDCTELLNERSGDDIYDPDEPEDTNKFYNWFCTYNEVKTIWDFEKDTSLYTYKWGQCTQKTGTGSEEFGEDAAAVIILTQPDECDFEKMSWNSWSDTEC